MRVVGECFFWYRLTRVFPDKFHRAVKRLCVNVNVPEGEFFQRVTARSAYDEQVIHVAQIPCHIASRSQGDHSPGNVKFPDISLTFRSNPTHAALTQY